MNARASIEFMGKIINQIIFVSLLVILPPFIILDFTMSAKDVIPLNYGKHLQIALIVYQ